MYKFFFKRLIDLILSLFGLIIFSPLYLFISILIFVQLDGPIFFRQSRAGKDGKEFSMIKFRTMTHRFKEKGLSESDAITKLGSLLRKTSLDEIPELFNILKGDMSIIGPRPLLLKYVPRYSKKHLKRLNVKPGLTGLAQISGRNCLSWSEKFDLDIEYINNLSMLTDIKIFFKTFFVVFKSKYTDPDNDEHMSEFIGYEDE